MTHEGGASSTDERGDTDERGGMDERGVMNEGVTNEARKRRANF